MSRLELRRIRPEEHSRAGDVCVAAYQPFLTGTEDDYAERLRDVATRDAQAEVWVAVRGGRVLGNVTYCPLGSPWREIGRDDEGEFRMLAVDPAAQGAGAGTALARLCEERAREDGAHAMVLSSLATMTAAHRIYGRLGYTRDTSRDWSPLPGVDLLAFGKPLRAARDERAVLEPVVVEPHHLVEPGQAARDGDPDEGRPVGGVW